MGSAVAADPFETLDARVRALASDARSAAHADIFADAVESTGLERCSLAMRYARAELLARALGVQTGWVLTLTGPRAVLTRAGAPAHLTRAAGHLAAVAAAWLEDRSGAVPVTRDLRAGVETIGPDFARRWLRRLTGGDARTLFREESLDAGMRIAWADGDQVRLEAWRPIRGPRVSRIFSTVGLEGREPELCEVHEERSGASVPRGRPLLEVFPGAMPEPLARRAFLDLCRAVDAARTRYGALFELGPLTPRVAWWTDAGALVLHHIGLESALRDAPRDCRTGVAWRGPRSPEAIRGIDDSGEAADVFHLAALFHRLVTGDDPFSEKSFAAMSRMREGSWPSLVGLVPASHAHTITAALSMRGARPTLLELARAFERAPA